MFEGVSENIFNPEVTEAGSTGRQILAALGQLPKVSKKVKEADKKARDAERSVTEREAALVKGAVADDVTAATTAVAASEKLAEIDAKSAAALAKAGAKFIPKEALEVKDAKNTLAAVLGREADITALNENTPITITDEDGNTTTSNLLQVHQAARKSALSRLAIFAANEKEFFKQGANADDVYRKLYEDAIRNFASQGNISFNITPNTVTGTSSLGTGQGASGLLPNKSQAKKIINKPT